MFFFAEFVFFRLKNIGAKAARKMLVKLTNKILDYYESCSFDINYFILKFIAEYNNKSK